MSTMILPAHIRQCMDRLEQAGFAVYAVGGCVRDAVLGLTPHDYDLCTAALPHEIRAVFSQNDLVLAGEKHGTVGVIMGKEVVEITTFRTEGGYQDNRHPDWVKFVPDIKEDLARRDFTVNAMAYSPTRGFQDPFGGREDLKNRSLRAVGDPYTRFQEDALRILRGVRFAVRFHLTPEKETMEAMNALSPLMDKLARERVFEELCKLLPLVDAPDLLRYQRILAAAIPELAPTIGFSQHSTHHAYDVYEHTAHVTAGVSPDLTLRWAGLLHDIGKVPTFSLDEEGRGHFFGHAEKSAEMANEILLRLKAPTALRQQVVLLIKLHMASREPDRKLIRRRLSQYGEETFRQLMELKQADFNSKGTGETTTCFEEIQQLLEEILAENACLQIKDLAISGKDLLALGFAPGKALGQCLNQLFRRVVDEELPNDREALLSAARETLHI